MAILLVLNLSDDLLEQISGLSRKKIRHPEAKLFLEQAEVAIKPQEKPLLDLLNLRFGTALLPPKKEEPKTAMCGDQILVANIKNVRDIISGLDEYEREEADKAIIRLALYSTH